MKTAISLPDDTFARASTRAAELGMSRSEFFAVAAQRYLDELDAESTTRQIDRALETVVHPDESSDDAVDAGHRTLDQSDDEW
jgi:metal-responsive CopG/Arc/MetJ family transcriptional regulator